MPELQLSIRSTRAHKIAKQLAKKERRTITQIVERALESYSSASTAAGASRESDADFWRRMARESQEQGGPDIDLDAIVREDRKPHTGIDV